MLNSYKTIALSTLFASNLCLATELETASTTENPTDNKTLKIFDSKTYLINARADQSEDIKDPFQGLNRKIYIFNDAIDQSILRPTAVFYSEITPEPAQGAYSNFKSNLKEPWNAVNQLFQGKPLRSLKTLSRFTVNTVTSLGFADPARHLNLTQEKESFGTTLGVWGVPSGPYIVLPFLGSSSLRDAVGLVPDSLARPNSYIIEQDGILWSNTALDVVSTRAQYLSVDSMLQGDKYAVMRDVYLQQRAFEIAEKRGEDTSASIFSDEFDDEEFLDDETMDENTGAEIVE